VGEVRRGLQAGWWPDGGPKIKSTARRVAPRAFSTIILRPPWLAIAHLGGAMGSQPLSFMPSVLPWLTAISAGSHFRGSASINAAGPSSFARRCCFVVALWASLVVLAQAQEPTTGTEESKKTPPSLEEVLVTGTHIRRVSPASPTIVLTDTDIANSGLSTSGDVLRNLPQSFAGGQQSTIGVNGSGPWQNLSNFNNSDSANLRGFGSDSTLVLINGLRAPVTGFQGSVDISAIPLVAIDHVEIVTDGASAVYGSDAVGGVVNFILKQNYSGADTSVEVGYPTNGGGVSQRYGQLSGRPATQGIIPAGT
jgi:outer membrane receptor protein involved in Fe transport